MATDTQSALEDPRRRVATSAVRAVREATALAHRRLEAGLGVMSPDLSLQRYRELISGFASLHETLDREIAAQLAGVTGEPLLAELDFEARRKHPALRSDMAALQVSPAPAAPFRLASLAAALGALYVCEGSTLGGRVIAPHVKATLGVDTPVAFFSSYAADVPRMWRACCRVIDALLDSPASQAEAAAVAVEVFDWFGSVLLR